jgi:hypothetical protein
MAYFKLFFGFLIKVLGMINELFSRNDFKRVVIELLK